MVSPTKKHLFQINFKWLVIAILVLYVPFHVLEEALGNFPLWMYQHYSLPKPLSYPHWLINNAIFLAVLLTGLALFYRNKDKNLHFGVGIAFWAILNSFEHIVFSIKDKQLSPGFFTATGFLALGIWAITKLKKEEKISIRLMLKSVLVAVGYWVTAILVIVTLGKFFAAYL